MSIRSCAVLMRFFKMGMTKICSTHASQTNRVPLAADTGLAADTTPAALGLAMSWPCEAPCASARHLAAMASQQWTAGQAVSQCICPAGAAGSGGIQHSFSGSRRLASTRRATPTPHTAPTQAEKPSAARCRRTSASDCTDVCQTSTCVAGSMQHTVPQSKWLDQ